MTTTTARIIVVYVFLRHIVVSGTLGYLLERVARDHADFGADRPEQTAPRVRGRIRIGKHHPVQRDINTGSSTRDILSYILGGYACVSSSDKTCMR